MTKNINEAWEHYRSVKDQTHGTEHIEAVVSNAKEIAKAFPTVNARDVEYAAILHDIGHQVQARSAAHGGHGSATYHPIIGVGIAKQYITELPAPSQAAILDAVQHHHGEVLPSTDVGRIVRDADRLVSTTNPETLALRAFQYRVDNGMEPNEAAKNAYHYLRHRKLTRLQGRQASFLTPQGEQMFKDNVSRLDNATKTYEDYAKLINARSGMRMVDTMYKQAMLHKIAGSGWDIHGYSLTPAEIDKVEADSAAKEEAYTKAYNIYADVKKRKPTKGFFENKSKFALRETAWNNELTKAKDSWLSMPGDDVPPLYTKRVGTPFDADTNYKLNANLDMGGRPQDTLAGYTTDTAYGGKQNVYLTKADLPKIKELYNRSAGSYAEDFKDEKWVASGVKGFNDKLDYLMKHPKVKTIRLEWE